MREIIEQPARLAGLDVSDITAAILQDARGEPGALPLVENALRVLWEQRQGNYLSGVLYADKGGIAGLLEEQADTLLERLDKDLPKGKADALELLLALTRVNDEGRHTRRRLPIGEARLVAGGKDADPVRGQKVIDYLMGRIAPDGSNRKVNGSLRLLTTLGDREDDQSIDLIHETLIRIRDKDAAGKPVGYWKTLYDYIDKNRNRGFYRDQLAQQAKEWRVSGGFGKWRKLAGWRDLGHYRKLRPARGSMEESFLRSSRVAVWLEAGGLALLLAFVGQSYWWTLDNKLPPAYMLMQQRFRLMDWGLLPEPLPEMVEITTSTGEFRVGEYDESFGEAENRRLIKEGEFELHNVGYPSTTALIQQPFAIGKYEVTYEQYDYFVWQRNRTYPGSTPDGRRGQHAVAHVTWNDANTYLQWLSDNTGENYRLPSEVEWEYAARAGSDTPYWWGVDTGKGNANCDGCGSRWDGKVAVVGSFKPNGWGVYDTTGNVWELTCSQWKPAFDGSEGRCVEAANSSGARVLRGGSCFHPPNLSRSSSRFLLMANYQFPDVGFRVVRTRPIGNKTQ